MVQNSQQHPWPLPTRCQLPLPTCNHKRNIHTFPNILQGSTFLQLRTTGVNCNIFFQHLGKSFFKFGLPIKINFSYTTGLPPPRGRQIQERVKKKLKGRLGQILCPLTLRTVEGVSIFYMTSVIITYCTLFALIQPTAKDFMNLAH